MEISNRLLELRKRNGMSQEKLADALGVSRQAVSKWESGQTTPDLNKITQISSIFHVSTDYLILGKEEIHVEEKVSDENTPEKKQKQVAIICMGAGIVILCILPLLAKLYQGYEFEKWGQCFTSASEYILRWPLLGITLLGGVLFLMGIVKLVKIYVKEK
ncbi:MAG: helix-turn-helix transcriptional regulator [Lachnospiraceae bacterium]|nr:helix-turn-helix transcriptional regulator [Lachnospiraceae bacterium]